MNYSIIDSGPQSEARLREFVEAARTRANPVTFLFTSEVAPQLKPIACDLNLEFAGHMPLMVLKAENVCSENKGKLQISRALKDRDIKSANRVMAKSFCVKSDSIDNTFNPLYIQGPGVDLFVAREDETIIGTIQTTCAGSIAGVWAMATLPDQQRRGVGHALLSHAVAFHVQRGAQFFFLISTPAGKPLYDKIGFKTVDEAQVWVLKQF